MVNFADIKADLPHWPDDVIDQWLLKLANRGADTGWPPPENLDGNAWKYILGSRALSWWKDVTWNLEEHDLEFDALSNGTKRIVNNLIDGYVNGVPNIYTVVDLSSKDRFLSSTNYLAKHGQFPRPIIVIRLSDGLSVIDGNHRVTALCACQACANDILSKGGVVPQKKQQLWMGTHKNGEVPID